MWRNVPFLVWIRPRPFWRMTPRAIHRCGRILLMVVRMYASRMSDQPTRRRTTQAGSHRRRHPLDDPCVAHRDMTLSAFSASIRLRCSAPITASKAHRRTGHVAPRGADVGPDRDHAYRRRAGGADPRDLHPGRLWRAVARTRRPHMRGRPDPIARERLEQRPDERCRVGGTTADSASLAPGSACR